MTAEGNLEAVARMALTPIQTPIRGNGRRVQVGPGVEPECQGCGRDSCAGDCTREDAESLVFVPASTIMLPLAKKRAFLTGEGPESDVEVLDVAGLGGLLPDFLDRRQEVVEGSDGRQGRP